MKLRYKIAGGIVGLLAVALVSGAVAISHTDACEPGQALPPGAATMKAVVYRCYGPPEVLSLEDVEKPVPGPEQVLVKVQAAGVNPLDWHHMRGSPYFMRMSSGLGTPSDQRMGVDFAGVIEAVGENVTRFQPGEAVFGGYSGAFGEYLVMPANRALARKPENVSFEQAASVPIAALTALQALRDKGQLQPGQRVLVNGASGGVGTFAVQIAKSFGAEVTGVCSTRNVDMVRSLGADHVFDYKQENYTESGREYDLILDMVGNHSPMANRKVLAPEGKMVIIGGPSGDWVGPLLRPLQAWVLGSFIDQELTLLMARLTPEDLNIMGELMQAGKVTPVIDRSYSLNQVADAVRYSESGRARGKIVISLD